MDTISTARAVQNASSFPNNSGVLKPHGVLGSNEDVRTSHAWHQTPSNKMTT